MSQFIDSLGPWFDGLLMAAWWAIGYWSGKYVARREDPKTDALEDT
jgi:hypothetical protein